jgi:peptidase E
MRLFLASHDFGNHQDELLKLMRGGKKALVITNARDYYSKDERSSRVSDKFAVMKQAGIEARELDLREYFGKKDELSDFIDSYAPDLIFAIGGNVFLLSTAYRLSGLDEILLNDLSQDKYVYGGGSAGAMVTAKTLKYYGHDHLSPEAVPGIYGVDAVFDGLGLIDEYIVPHADVPSCLTTTNTYLKRIKNGGQKAILLNQLSAVIIDGTKTMFLT